MQVEVAEVAEATAQAAHSLAELTHLLPSQVLFGPDAQHAAQQRDTVRQAGTHSQKWTSPSKPELSCQTAPRCSALGYQRPCFESPAASSVQASWPTCSGPDCNTPCLNVDSPTNPTPGTHAETSSCHSATSPSGPDLNRVSCPSGPSPGGRGHNSPFPVASSLAAMGCKQGQGSCIPPAKQVLARLPHVCSKDRTAVLKALTAVLDRYAE